MYKVKSTMIAFTRRVRLLFKVSKFDKVFIHREATPVGPPWFEWVVAKVFRKPIIYDFDDAIWLPNSSKANEKLIGKFKNHGKTAKNCSWAKTVVVGNEFLAEYAREFCEDVRVIPTTVDTEGYHNPELYREDSSEYRVGSTETGKKGYKEQGSRYKDLDKVSREQKSNNSVSASSLKPEASGLPTIGWTGTHSTLKQLVPLFPTLEEVFKKLPFRFLLIADQAPEEMPDFVEFIKWKKETEIEDLMEIDIGVMPLFDSEWERGKCGFKAIQYSALGIPSVVSAVGVNSDVVQTGITGYVVNEMYSDNRVYTHWDESLTELVKSRNLRIKMGKAGRSRMIEKYSKEKNEKKYFQLFF